MPEFCLNCNKPLPKGVQSSFCSKTCWIDYKDRKGFAINPERQATVMIKDTSRSLITSLKEEIEKKDEIIQHQDKLIQEYRETLESREREILKYQAKIKYFEGLVNELRQSPPPKSQVPVSTPAAVRTAAPAIDAAKPPALGTVSVKSMNSDSSFQVLPIEVIVTASDNAPSTDQVPDGFFKSFWRKLFPRT